LFTADNLPSRDIGGNRDFVDLAGVQNFDCLNNVERALRLNISGILCHGNDTQAECRKLGIFFGCNALEIHFFVR
jgi:hypothetical protein